MLATKCPQGFTNTRTMRICEIAEKRERGLGKSGGKGRLFSVQSNAAMKRGLEKAREKEGYFPFRKMPRRALVSRCARAMGVCASLDPSLTFGPKSAKTGDLSRRTQYKYYRRGPRYKIEGCCLYLALNKCNRSVAIRFAHL
jgi:hypothetical protein